MLGDTDEARLSPLEMSRSLLQKEAAPIRTVGCRLEISPGTGTLQWPSEAGQSQRVEIFIYGLVG